MTNIPERAASKSVLSRALVLGLAAVLVAAIFWGLAAPRSANPTTPLVVNGTEWIDRSAKSTLRIASFNIHSGKGLDGIRDLSRTADCLRGVDLAGLYEVKSLLSSGNVPQSRLLGEQLKTASVFVPTVREWGREGFGNALLTRVPLTRLHRIPLPGTQPKRSRNAILASIELDGASVQILATHLDTNVDRVVQLKAVADLFLALKEPAVLMGDFNTNQNAPVLQQLLTTPGVNDPLHEYYEKDKQGPGIDWILTRGLECVAAEYQSTPASDHPVVWAELKLPSGSSSKRKPESNGVAGNRQLGNTR